MLATRWKLCKGKENREVQSERKKKWENIKRSTNIDEPKSLFTPSDEANVEGYLTKKC